MIAPTLAARTLGGACARIIGTRSGLTTPRAAVMMMMMFARESGSTPCRKHWKMWVAEARDLKT